MSGNIELAPPLPRIITTDAEVASPHHATGSNHSTPSGSGDHEHASYLTPYSGMAVPPSPTLTSTSSNVRFEHEPPSPIPVTSLALRDNDPHRLSPADGDNKGGLGLGLANGEKGHRRISSVATWSTAEFDEDGKRIPAFHPLPEADKEALGWWAKRAEKKRIEEEEKEEKARLKEEAKQLSAHIDPDKDDTDPSPFREKPSRLAMLVDPKSLEDLERIGGIQGLLDGLGVDPKKGLTAGLQEGNRETGAPRSGAEMPSGSGPQWSASTDRRREVYGKNELPARKSKNIFQLMWIALKDKVLVCLF
jgi:Ca2+-transporting ATPase